MYNTQSEPSGKIRTPSDNGVINIGALTVIYVPFWCGIIDNGEAMHTLDQRYIGIPLPSAQFCFKLGTSLKNKVY